MLRETGCRAVMIGRAALGHPWIFRETAAWLLRGETAPPPSNAERLDMVWQHAVLLARDAHRADVDLDASLPASARGQLAHYIRGLPGAASARARIVQLNRLRDVHEIVQDLRDAV